VLQRFYQGRNKIKKNFIPWIERLLKTPMPDHRKYCIWRILAPYLSNVKHLSFEESFDRINRWLDKCNKLEALDFDADTKINDCLNGVINKGYLPVPSLLCYGCMVAHSAKAPNEPIIVALEG
jgi:non-catalytic primase subunit PriX-like protein